MAQIFKTISLEDRLKSSPYNNLPTKSESPQISGKASIRTDKAELATKLSSVQITRFGIFEHTSPTQVQQFGVYQHTSPTTVTLARISVNQGEVVLPTQNFLLAQGGTSITPYFYTPSQGGTSPDPFTVFLTQGGEQPSFFTFAPNQGTINIGSYAYIPNQGSVTLPFSLFLPIQGSVTLPNWLYLPYQGQTSLAPYVFRPDHGLTNLQLYVFDPNQGSANLTSYFYTPNQGITNLTSYLFIPNQGITNLTSYLFSPNQGITSLSPYVFIPNQGQIVISFLTVEPDQGLTEILDTPGTVDQGSIILPRWSQRGGLGAITGLGGEIRQSTDSFVEPELQRFRWTVEGSEFRLNPERRHGSATLQLIRYEADRALARILPEVKHGTVAINSTRYWDGSINLIRNDVETLSQRSGQSFYGDADTAPYLPTSRKSATLIDEQQQVTLNGIGDKGTAFLPSKISQKTNREKIERYYQIADLQVKAKNLIPRIDENVVKGRRNWQNKLTTAFDFDGSAKQTTGTTKLTANKDAVPTSANVVKDLITLKIDSLLSDGKSVQFRAFLTSFSDSITVNWADVNHIGRQETLKTFKGMSRGFSLSFKIAAFTFDDMDQMYRQLNRLLQIATVGAVAGGVEYMYGPICSITVGSWFTDTPCIFNSVKMDTQPTEYSWDVQERFLPMIVDVSVDGIILTGHTGAARLTRQASMLSLGQVDLGVDVASFDAKTSPTLVTPRPAALLAASNETNEPLSSQEMLAQQAEAINNKQVSNNLAQQQQQTALATQLYSQTNPNALPPGFSGPPNDATLQATVVDAEGRNIPLPANWPRDENGRPIDNFSYSGYNNLDEALEASRRARENINFQRSNATPEERQARFRQQFEEATR